MTDGTVEIYFHDYQEEKKKHEAPKIYKQASNDEISTYW